MICICGHASEEHDDGINECSQCDCDLFVASTGDADDYVLADWGDE